MRLRTRFLFSTVSSSVPLVSLSASVRFWSWSALVLCALLLFSACDSAPGPARIDVQAPTLADFSFSPQAVNAEQLPEGWSDDGTTITGRIEVSVTADDPDGDVRIVNYVVQSPLSAVEPLATGRLNRNGGIYSATIDLSFPKGAVGAYTVLVYAIDDDNLQSGEIRGLLRFSAEGNPPVIETITADPDVVTPDTETLQFVVTVSDPDGLDNISRVQVMVPNGQTFNLFDDGATQGDATPGDGQYTTTFDVSGGATSGTQTFSFQAFDRTGLASEVVDYDITVE